MSWNIIVHKNITSILFLLFLIIFGIDLSNTICNTSLAYKEGALIKMKDFYTPFNEELQPRWDEEEEHEQDNYRI